MHSEPRCGEEATKKVYDNVILLLDFITDVTAGSKAFHGSAILMFIQTTVLVYSYINKAFWR